MRGHPAPLGSSASAVPRGDCEVPAARSSGGAGMTADRPLPRPGAEPAAGRAGQAVRAAQRGERLPGDRARRARPGLLRSLPRPRDPPGRAAAALTPPPSSQPARARREKKRRREGAGDAASSIRRPPARAAPAHQEALASRRDLGSLPTPQSAPVPIVPQSGSVEVKNEWSVRVPGAAPGRLGAPAWSALIVLLGTGQGNARWAAARPGAGVSSVRQFLKGYAFRPLKTSGGPASNGKELLHSWWEVMRSKTLV